MITEFVSTYGYVAVFVGTLLEGETLLIAAGFAAHQGLLDARLVVLVAMAGATLGDQLAFFLGRWKGELVIDRFPSLQRHKVKIDKLLARYDALFILINRFIYGLRIAGPLIMGASCMNMLRFATFNVIGAALWALLISGLGYMFGLAVNTLLTDAKRIEEIILIAILVIGLLFLLWHTLKAHNKNKNKK